MAIEMWRADDSGRAVAERRLQGAVFDAVAGDPLLRSDDLRVEVDRKTIRLSGSVTSYIEKVAAERAARRVPGVSAVRNDISVVPPSSHQRSDSDIARAAERVLEWNVLLAHAELQVTVHAGCVELAGALGHDAERRVAEESVECLVGVTGIRNLITLNS